MYTERNQCAVCGCAELVKVIDLPKLPLTGLYISASENRSTLPKYVQEGFDQALMYCNTCGHGQLLNIIDSCYIYDDTYTHRGSKSPIATGGNDFFVEFLKKVAQGRTFKKALDVGCNDLYLLRKLEPFADKLLGVDPIWKNQDHQCTSKIAVRGGFVEDVDVLGALGGNPDLVVSAHTFEHINDPKSVLKQLINNATENALFVIEVPSFDNLLRNYRFDQVFHQHLHYYTLSSFSRLLFEIGGSYIDHTCNYGFWGGTLLVAFRKGIGNEVPKFTKPELGEIASGYRIFKEQLASAINSLKYRSSRQIYGYGAAQMLPVLAYHMESDLSFLKAILDDNPTRWGCKYPSIACPIIPMEKEMDLKDSDVMITALDSARPILRKVSQTGAQRIVLPLNIL